MALIEKINFTIEPLEAEYYDTTFKGCNFSGLKPYELVLENCELIDCNLYGTHFQGGLHEVTFRDCYMQGSHFAELNAFSSGLAFRGCNLNYADFNHLSMPGLIFQDCELREALLDNARIRKSLFERCNLERASFHRADLRDCDFTTSFNYTINPDECQLKGAQFSRENIDGLLAHLGIKIF